MYRFLLLDTENNLPNNKIILQKNDYVKIDIYIKTKILSLKYD